MALEKENQKDGNNESLRVKELEKMVEKLQKKIGQVERNANFYRRVLESRLNSFVWGLAVLLFMTLIAIFCVAKYERRVDALQEEVIMLQEEVSALQTTANIHSD